MSTKLFSLMSNENICNKNYRLLDSAFIVSIFQVNNTPDVCIFFCIRICKYVYKQVAVNDRTLQMNDENSYCNRINVA